MGGHKTRIPLKKLRDTEQARTKQLKKQFYRKPEEFASKRNICIMLKYIQFKPIDQTTVTNEAFEKRVKAIENWNGKFK